MFKLVVVLSAFVALAAAGSLRINPEELHLIWDTIEEDVKLRQHTAEEEIRAIFVPKNVLIDDAKSKVINDIEELSESYKEGIRHIEEEARGEDIERCVREADEELERINEDLVRDHYELIDRVSGEADEAIEHAIGLSQHALEELQEISERVFRCSEVECATELNIEVVEFYEKIVKDIDDAVSHAEETALIKLPLDLQDQQVNRQSYEETIDHLLEQVEQCARRTN